MSVFAANMQRSVCLKEALVVGKFVLLSIRIIYFEYFTASELEDKSFY